MHSIAIACAVVLAQLPTPVPQPGARADTYYVNDGANARIDPDCGEFGLDLGGFIPFARFDDARPFVGHVIARRWDAAKAGIGFREMMLENFSDLRALDTKLRKFGRARVLPIPPGEAVLESPLVKRATWWGKPVTFHSWRIHGGPALICVPDSSLVTPPAPIHLLLVNLPQHENDFLINQNQTTTAYSAPVAGWSGPPGSPLLAPDEQALERGDVVVITQENFSESIWIALQRTQETEAFVRDQFLRTIGIQPDPSLSRSYLYGGSWGGLVAAVLALLQPRVYAGSASYSMDDWAYGIGDQRMLTSFHQAATGMLAPDLPNDPFYAPFLAMVDLLGIRFDAPQTLASGKTMEPWDLAAFCINRREFELAVPIQGLMCGEDWTFNCHWSANNAAYNAAFQTGLRFNLEHGGVHGVLAGFNEYAFWKGDEWATLIAGTGPAAANLPLVPDTPLPHGLPAYPDPYDATLRHVHVATGSEDFLQEIDLSTASHSPGSGVLSLGQGVWPALNDSLFIGDVDGDARTEVVFGNLDGHVHVMEIDPARDPADPFRLYDEWKSPYLGRELYSLTVHGNGAAAEIFAADGLGQIWRIEPAAAPTPGFTVTGAPLCSPQSAPQHLYPGPTRWLSIGDFAKALPGLELLALNRFSDWSMFSAADGSPIPGGRLQRGLHALGPTGASVVDVDGDGDDELLVPCVDGFLWMLDPDASGDFAAAAEPNPVALSPFTGHALYRVEPADFDLAPGPSHLLLVGHDDQRGVGGKLSPNVITILDPRRRTILAEFDARRGDRLDVNSFAWIKPPKPDEPAVFALAGATTVQKYLVRAKQAAGSVSQPLKITSQASARMVELVDEYVRGSQIDAIEPFSWNGQVMLVVALANGRFGVLDKDLQFARDSSSEYGIDPDVTGVNPAQPWYSNRSLARTFACDLVQSKPGGDASLYFAEFSQPLLAGPRRHRVGKLDLPAGGGPPVWDAYVTAAPNGAGNPLRVDFNRRLRFTDADGDGASEPHVYAEAGDLYFDATLDRVREFCDVAWNPSFFPNQNPTQWKLLGGLVFEVDDLANGVYRYLSGFHPPRDPTQPCVDFGGSEWWLPQVGPNRLTGQIANHSQSVFESTLGASMKVVNLPDPAQPGRVAPHVVIGTNGGYVYAIEPGDPATTANGGTPSTLAWASIDLGTSILGLDAGDLDGDVDVELAVGAYVDTGSYGDWVKGDKTRNRAHLVLLDPQVVQVGGPGSFVTTELDGDDLVGYGQGIGAGVTGVKIDDVDGDGVNEIWCGDAVGHLWLFRRTGAQWRCVFRSADLGAYPGVYNNIHPIKDQDGRTEKLVVVSAGYVMAFQVDWARLPGM